MITIWRSVTFETHNYCMFRDIAHIQSRYVSDLGLPFAAIGAEKVTFFAWHQVCWDLGYHGILLDVAQGQGHPCSSDVMTKNNPILLSEHFFISRVLLLRGNLFFRNSCRSQGSRHVHEDMIKCCWCADNLTILLVNKEVTKH